MWGSSCDDEYNYEDILRTKIEDAVILMDEDVLCRRWRGEEINNNIIQILFLGKIYLLSLKNKDKRLNFF